MLTGELRNQIDGIWNDFWSGEIANPLQVIEQITYLIFIKRLDEMQEVEERKATTLGTPVERRIFPEGADDRGEPYRISAGAGSRASSRARCSGSSTSTSSRSYVPSTGTARPVRATCATPGCRSPAPRCSTRSCRSLMRSIWATATPRATSTITCSARSQPPARTGSSAGRVISSRSWSS